MKDSLEKKYPPQIFLSAVALLYLTACGVQPSSSSSTSALEDTSASGTIGAAVGGALSGTSKTTGGAQSSSRGMITDTFAASASCPTLRTPAGTTCTGTGGTLWLTDSDCSFTGTTSKWTGIHSITLSGPSPVMTCGTFPQALANQTLSRQFVKKASTTPPGVATVTPSSGRVTTIDHATANLGNFDTLTIAPIIGTGYGSVVGFDSGSARNSLKFAQRISTVSAAGTELNQFSIYTATPLSISEAALGSTSRTVSGTVTIYHNLLKVVGTSTLTDLTHSDSCCLPTSGSISTTFAAGLNVSPTTEGEALVGKTEKLTFTDCGTATLVSTSGSTTSVMLTRCL